jgi:hypothetical protein
MAGSTSSVFQNMNYFFFPFYQACCVYIYIFIFLQALERCQLKDIVASKPEKLDALGLLFREQMLLFYIKDKLCSCFRTTDE